MEYDDYEDTATHDGSKEYLDFSTNLKKGKATVMFGDVGELEAGMKRMKGKMRVGDMHMEGEMKYNGDWKAKAKAPMFGNGIAEGELNSAGDWEVKMAKPMFGGELGLDAQERGGSKRYYIQYKKTF